MEWTKEIPTKAGHYWFCYPNNSLVRACEIRYFSYAPEIFTTIMDGQFRLLEKVKGYWQGPIELPEPPTP